MQTHWFSSPFDNGMMDEMGICDEPRVDKYATNFMRHMNGVEKGETVEAGPEYKTESNQ